MAIASEVKVVDNLFDEAMDGFAAVALSVYLIIVFYRGNLFPLLNELKKETGYLEFVVAIYIIYLLLKIEATRPIVYLFVVGAVTVMLLKMSRNFDLNAFRDFQAGKINLFQLLSGALGAI